MAEEAESPRTTRSRRASTSSQGGEPLAPSGCQFGVSPLFNTDVRFRLCPPGKRIPWGTPTRMSPQGLPEHFRGSEKIADHRCAFRKKKRHRELRSRCSPLMERIGTNDSNTDWR
eukprot:3493249-Rhodomonas_salina.2